MSLDLDVLSTLSEEGADDRGRASSLGDMANPQADGRQAVPGARGMTEPLG
jgi:hypothetical protein